MTAGSRPEHRPGQPLNPITGSKLGSQDRHKTGPQLLVRRFRPRLPELAANTC
jgi:hypothetical protein